MSILTAFVKGQAQAKVTSVNAQRVVNMEPEITQDGKTIAAFYSAPGLTKEFSFGAGPTRCNGELFNGMAYSVSGDEFFQIDTNGVASLIGTLTTNTGRVSIVPGTTSYIALVDGTDGYTYDGTTFAKITDPDFPSNATHITFLNGRFITIDNQTGRFYISAEDDPTSWDPLDFANAESYPDNAKAAVATDTLLWIIGDASSEPFYDSGDSVFPFERYLGGYSDYGIQAPHSLVRGNKKLFFLAKSARGGVSVVMTKGALMQVISTPELDNQIGKLINEDAYAFVYEKDGHEKYVLTLPTGNRTWVYDSSMPVEFAWTERTTFLNSKSNRWRPAGHVYFNGIAYVGDYATGDYYKIDDTVYTDNGGIIERILQGKFIHEKRERITIRRVEFEYDSGIGLITGQGSDPTVMFMYSVDGARTWSNELWQSVGKIGKYKHRSVFSQLGSDFEFSFINRMTDPVPWTLKNMYLN